MIGQNVTGTNDHENETHYDTWTRQNILKPDHERQRENMLFQAIPNWRKSSVSADLRVIPHPLFDGPVII
ncbi:hypothetical protein [Nitrobacter winogradskyi]|uniref:hypothetical protein n=1 Tax=Nitrobacter winogradskyi TaxID=913 RepID=UPI0002F08C60|nr:hypothetical protein [Nitrobacter winogradskyi]